MRPYRKISGQDSAARNPGLTPIDGIHGDTRTSSFEPDSTTGRLPSQEVEEENATAPKHEPRAKQVKRKS
jgi:hypothetical protein